MKLPNIVVKTINKTGLISKGDLLLLAISGGGDSVALLDICCQIRHELGVRLHVVHADHCTRLSAKRDARFVSALVKRYNLPLTQHVRLTKGISPLSEQAARQWRMEVLVKTAVAIKAKAILTAHHADDLAETVLMRVIRGAGLAGLRAVLPVGQWGGISVIRPLLGITRQEIEAYNRQHKLKWVHDETNDQDIFLRNKIRAKLMPLLVKEYNPSLVEGLAGLANQAIYDYDYINQQAKISFKKIAQINRTTIRLDLVKLRRLPVSLRRQVFRQTLEALCHDLTEFTSMHILAIEGLLQAGDKARVILPRAITATTDSIHLIVNKK